MTPTVAQPMTQPAAVVPPLPPEYAAQNDADLLASVEGAHVTFEYPGCAHYYPRQRMVGRIVGLRTCRDGVRQLLVETAELSLPKYVNLNDCQFAWAMVGERE